VCARYDGLGSPCIECISRLIKVIDFKNSRWKPEIKIFGGCLTLNKIDFIKNLSIYFECLLRRIVTQTTKKFELYFRVYLWNEVHLASLWIVMAESAYFSTTFNAVSSAEWKKLLLHHRPTNMTSVWGTNFIFKYV